MPERIPSGIANMEAQAELALAQTRAIQAAEAGNLARQEAIEQRAVSPEVSALNDQAMFAIYGSEIPVVGNSYGKDTKKGNADFDPDYRSQSVKEVEGTVSYTVVDTEGNVIGSPEKPLRGKLDEIRSNPRFGKTQKERDTAAEAYADDIQTLVDDGFELAQAKLIQDLREKDGEKIAHLTAKHIANGMGTAEAHQAAIDKYEALDEKRRQLIKEEGVFTHEDYGRVRKGENLYPNGAHNPEAPDAPDTPEAPDEPEAPETPDTPEDEGDEPEAPEEDGPEDEDDATEELPEVEGEPLNERLASARENLAKLSVEMRLHSRFNRKLRARYEEALKQYDALYNKAGADAVTMLREAGVSEDKIKEMAVEGIIEEKTLLTREEAKYVQDESHKYVVDKDHDKRWKMAYKKVIADWSRAGRFKRTLILGAVGVGIPVVTAGVATVAGVAGFVAGATALASKANKARPFHRVVSDGKEPALLLTGFEKARIEDATRLQEHLRKVIDTRVVAGSVERRVGADQKRNTRLLGGAAVSSVLGIGGGFGFDRLLSLPWYVGATAAAAKAENMNSKAKKAKGGGGH